MKTCQECTKIIQAKERRCAHEGESFENRSNNFFFKYWKRTTKNSISNLKISAFKELKKVKILEKIIGVKTIGTIIFPVFTLDQNVYNVIST